MRSDRSPTGVAVEERERQRQGSENDRGRGPERGARLDAQEEEPRHQLGGADGEDGGGEREAEEDQGRCLARGDHAAHEETGGERHGEVQDGARDGDGRREPEVVRGTGEGEGHQIAQRADRGRQRRRERDGLAGDPRCEGRADPLGNGRAAGLVGERAVPAPAARDQRDRRAAGVREQRPEVAAPPALRQLHAPAADAGGVGERLRGREDRVIGDAARDRGQRHAGGHRDVPAGAQQRRQAGVDVEQLLLGAEDRADDAPHAVLRAGGLGGARGRRAAEALRVRPDELLGAVEQTGDGVGALRAAPPVGREHHARERLARLRDACGPRERGGSVHDGCLPGRHGHERAPAAGKAVGKDGDEAAGRDGAEVGAPPGRAVLAPRGREDADHARGDREGRVRDRQVDVVAAVHRARPASGVEELPREPEGAHPWPPPRTNAA